MSPFFLKWLFVFFLALALRIYATTRERRAATHLTLLVYASNSEKGVALLRSLIPHSSGENALAGEIVNDLPLFSSVVALFYSLFAFSLYEADARTPNVLTLYKSEKDFYELYDPDVLRWYDDWRATFFFDAFSVVLLLAAIVVIGSWSVFLTLIR